MVSIRRLACVLASVASSGLANPSHGGERFMAYSWSHVHAPPTAHVEQLQELAPWTDIPALAAALNAKPPGRRWVVIYCLTDAMADHPADRCIRREVRQVVRNATPKPSMSALNRPVAPLSRNAGPSRPAVSPIVERVTRDVLTPYRGPWIDAGTRAMKERMRQVMTRLVASGAKVDGFVMSNETNLGAANVVGVPGTAEAISSDPRWPALSAQLGLPRDIRGMNWGTDLYFRWTDAMAGRFDAALNGAVFHPIRAAYPGAKVSNYNSGAIGREVAWPDINGHLDRKTTAGFGTHDSSEFYGWLADGRISKIKGTQNPSRAWMAFRLEVRKARGMLASSQRPNQAWIASRSWQGETWGKVAIASHPLWDELVMQLGMHGFEDFLEFSPDNPQLTRSQNMTQRVADRAHLDAVLATLNAQTAGMSGPVLTRAQPDWDDQVIATGRQTNGGTIWRFSFAEPSLSATVRLDDGSTVQVSPEGDSQGCWLFVPDGKRVILDSRGRAPLMQVGSQASNPPAEARVPAEH
jgi:hypothetical protein